MNPSNQPANQAASHPALCGAIQPDGRRQKCIRFQDHLGPHQSFVAEWNAADSHSRRRAPKTMVETQAVVNAARQNRQGRREDFRKSRSRRMQGTVAA